MGYTEQLRSWVDEQRSRGVKKEDVKELLLRDGHPPSSLAVVDELYALERGSFDKKHMITAAIAAAILMVSVAAAAFLLSGNKENEVNLAGEGKTLADVLVGGKAGVGSDILASIKPEYLPGKIALAEQTTHGGAKAKRAEWNITGAQLSAESISLPKGDEVSSVNVNIILPSTGEITSSVTSSMLSKYFSMEARNYSCYRKQGTGLIICDFFSQSERKGSGALFNPDSKEALLYQCEASPASGRSSCLPS